MKRFVGDRSGHNRDGKSVESETPPRFAKMPDHDDKQPKHREGERCEEKYASGFNDVMSEQRVPRFKQTDYALILKITSNELSR